MKKAIMLAMLLILVTPLIKANSLENTTTSTLLFHFNNTLIDNHNYTYEWAIQSGTDMYGPDQLGNINEAIYFANSNYYQINNTYNQLTNLKNFTYETVFLCNSSSDRQTMHIMDGGTPLLAFQVWDNLTLRLFIRDSSGNTNDYYSTNTIDDSTWHYFAFTRDTTNNYSEYYLDGTLVANNTLNATGSINTGIGMYLGAESTGNRQAENCTISSLRISEKHTTQTEIQATNTTLFTSSSTPTSSKIPNITLELYDDLRGLWYLDENTDPYISQINSTAFTLYSQNSNPNSVTGIINSSQEFTQTDTCGSSCQSLRTNETWLHIGDYTYNFWVKMTTPSQPTILIDHRPTSSGYHRQSFTLSSNQNDQISVDQTNGGASPPECHAIWTVPDLFDGEWHMLTVTQRFNGGNSFTHTLYIDSLSNGSQGSTCTGGLATGLTHYTYIGKSSYNSTGVFQGTIDELGLWNRELNSTEVDYLYNSNNALRPSPVGISDINWQNNKTAYGENFVRSLLLNTSFYCSYPYSAILSFFVNDTLTNTTSKVCNGENQTWLNYYTHNSSQPFYSYFDFTTGFDPENRSGIYSNSSFFSDLENPIVILNYTVDTGFNQTGFNFSLTCQDNESGTLEYNLTYNDVNYYLSNESNNTIITNFTNATDISNILHGVCSDAISQSSFTQNVTIYKKFLVLWDEVDNTLFDVSNLSEAKVYFDDNSSIYDFKSNGVNNVSFISESDVKVRFELIEDDDTLITRYVDVTLFENETNILICANKDDITHFQQLIISSVQRPVKLINVFSNCYVAADYTRFAYQDAFVLQSFTISAPYDLIAFDTNQENPSILTGLDGSISSFYNVDTIEFKNQGYNINVFGSSLTASKEDENTIRIKYQNVDVDNSEATLTITRLDNNNLLTTYIPDDPNNFSLLFDFTTQTNITNSTLFLLNLAITDTSGNQETIKRYISPSGSVGFINPTLAVVISIIAVIVGLSLVIVRATFSFFGIIIILLNMAFLGFAVQSWYVLFFEIIYSIILVYAVLLLNQKNFPTVS